WIAVHGFAAYAGTEGHVRLVEHDPAGRVERMVTSRGQVVGELLDAWFVADGRMRILRADRWFGRILAVETVDLVELLGLRVVGLHLLVPYGPGRRNPVVVMQDAEVFGAQPEEGGSVEL